MGVQQLLLSAKGGGIGAGVITLTDQVIAHSGLDGQLRAGYELNINGMVNAVRSPGATTPLQQWVDPPAAAGNFEVQVVAITGGTVNGTLGAWLPMTATYQWYVEANTFIGQSVVAEIAVTIRRVGQMTPEATAYIDLNVHA